MNPHNLPSGHLSYCQICGSSDLELVLDLGYHPPCDSLLTGHQLNEPESMFPLRFWRCPHCRLAQIDYVVDPSTLFFPEYPYRSGITENLSRNLQSIAQKLIDHYGLQKGSLVVDIGSNDGTLLHGFKDRGMKVLGVEPTNISKIAVDNGIPTVQAFFSRDVACRIREENGSAVVVTAANMFAHVAMLGDLIMGVEELLCDGGLFITESHYLLSLIETLQYDSIYHEHLKYYSVQSLVKLFEYYNFTLIHVERIPNYGGSIRAYAKKGKGHPIAPSVQELLHLEKTMGLDDPETYDLFRDKVVRSKLDLQAFALDANRQGKRMIGIGCPGRASTLINYCNIDPVLMPYIAEQSTSLKLGMYLPGKHIPIVDEKQMFEESPEYAVMLSWHYAEPIIRKLYAKGLKSKIVVPLPILCFSDKNVNQI
jgi:hypothetical protein